VSDRRERGVTLVELLIALALLAFILLGIVPLFLGSVKSNYSASEYTSVNMMARDRLEQLMNLTFADPRLAVGIYDNDQAAFLPDPANPSNLSTIVNPFWISYQVSQWQIPDPTTVASGASFTPTQITAANQPFHYKRIDVTVASHLQTANPKVQLFQFGIGSRTVRVSGMIPNPEPRAILTVADTCVLGGTTKCP
jgi:prepilin-type N-terminal cleavage/methylation domain-containing protein